MSEVRLAEAAERAETVRQYHESVDDPHERFFRAYHFLASHPMFRRSSAWGEEECAFLESLWVDVVHVDPETQTIEDDDARNTAVEVWLETGPWCAFPDDDAVDASPCWSLDHRLDAGGGTWEEAIIALAVNVDHWYGDDRREAIDDDDETAIDGGE